MAMTLKKMFVLWQEMLEQEDSQVDLFKFEEAHISLVSIWKCLAKVCSI